jgi:hypothetical protein
LDGQGPKCVQEVQEEPTLSIVQEIQVSEASPTQNSVNIILINGLLWKIDPANVFLPRGATKRAVVNACGVLPHWINPADSRLAHEQLQSNYRFFMGWSELGPGSSYENMVWDDLAPGAFTYPEDPTSFPLMSATLTSEELGQTENIYFHQYSFVLVHNTTTGERFYTRMD